MKDILTFPNLMLGLRMAGSTAFAIVCHTISLI